MPDPANPDPTPNPAASRLEAIVGGTLALLTHCACMPNLAAFDRIACKLALIARLPEASDTWQAVCTGLFTDGLGPLDVQDGPRGGEWRDVWLMPPAMQ